jgi:hypothetical protein
MRHSMESYKRRKMILIYKLHVRIMKYYFFGKIIDHHHENHFNRHSK